MSVTAFRSVLTQAELRRPQDLVLVRWGRGLLRVVALERRVEGVKVPGGDRRSPARAVLDGSLARASARGGTAKDLGEEGPEGWQRDEGDGCQVLDDRADCGLPEPPSIVCREDALQRDCFRYRAACRERAEADETAWNFSESAYLVGIQLESVRPV